VGKAQSAQIIDIVLTANRASFLDKNSFSRIFSELAVARALTLFHSSSMSSDSPLVSVLMAVYNGERYLRQAMDSVFRQTFTNFEFIIINDGSADDTDAIIRSYRDGRLRIVNQANHGLVYSLNRGIELARGTYIARMDADDISAPERLATEVKLFASHPKAAVVGTSIMRIDEAGRQLGAEYYLAKNTELCQDLAIRCPFAHGSVMMRKDLVRQVGGYRQEFWPAEDYDLWRRMAAIGEFANSLEPLYLYRGNAQGISATQDSRQLDLAMRISGELLDGYPKDIPLRRCLAFYERAPEEARAAAIERIIEDYFRISVAYARRGKILVAIYRYVKLALSGRVGLEFATKTLANKLGIRTAPIGGSLRA